LRVVEDVHDALGVAVHRRCPVAIAANAKPVFCRDLHQIGGLRKHTRGFLFLQRGFLDPIVSSESPSFRSRGASYERMCRSLYLCFFLAASIHAQTGSLSVVSAASYRSVIAPDSLAAMFGTTLARSTVFATLDADGNLPIELAFTRVE